MRKARFGGLFFSRKFHLPAGIRSMKEIIMLKLLQSAERAAKKTFWWFDGKIDEFLIFLDELQAERMRRYREEQERKRENQEV